MKRYDKVTPDGTRDLLFDECVSRAQVAGLSLIHISEPTRPY